MTHDYGSSPNPHRRYLYKDKPNAAISGVCAGLARYLGLDTSLVRIATVVFAVFATPMTVPAYIIAAFIMPSRPPTGEIMPLSNDEDRFWRGVSRRPEATFSNVRYRFRDMDERLADIEKVVTSDEWRLRRQFKDIEERG